LFGQTQISGESTIEPSEVRLIGSREGERNTRESWDAAGNGDWFHLRIPCNASKCVVGLALGISERVEALP